MAALWSTTQILAGVSPTHGALPNPTPHPTGCHRGSNAVKLEPKQLSPCRSWVNWPIRPFQPFQLLP
jgi:hypothetical protein